MVPRIGVVHPVQSTLAQFRELYEAKLVGGGDALRPTFDLRAALAEATQVQGREPIFHEDGEERGL